MNTLTRSLKRLVALTIATGSFAMATSSHAQSNVTVIEYINIKSNVRIVTGDPTEQSILNGISDFKKTGSTFAARAASAAGGNYQPVCRYAITVAPGYVTHFYGLPAECAIVQDYVNRGVVNNFVSEGLVFAVEPALSNGSCPATSPFPIRRALRLGTPVEAANHRYATNLTDYNDALIQGWTGENVVFCVSASTPETPRPSLLANAAKKDFCEMPRTGTSAATGLPYPDKPGTRSDEKDYIRYWTDYSYLWYRELPNPTTNALESTESYFDKLKTPAIAPAGGAKDRFSFSTSTTSVDNTNAGIVYGYGVSWASIASSPPRRWVASIVAPGSPAAAAGVERGDAIQSIDGEDFVSGNNVNVLNNGLFPSAIGESHRFVLTPAAGGGAKNVTLTSASLPLVSVPASGVINTATGKVGYIVFTTFDSFTSEKAIVDAISGLATQGISDLVLDLRYNSGGYVYISAQTAYMIAGAARTANKRFEISKTNDKKPFGDDDVYPFYNVGSGFAGAVAAGTRLPSLNLGRVFILTTGRSCSASESLINGLRGIDVEVIQIGGTTCGKPYGFSGVDNCGVTYYPIQFTGTNEKGEGDFINGFAPRCVVPDDLTKKLGDINEKQLAAALTVRQTGACPAGTAATDFTLKRAMSEQRSNDDTLDFPAQHLQTLKLATPRDVRRDLGGSITPRTPTLLGDTTTLGETR